MPTLAQLAGYASDRQSESIGPLLARLRLGRGHSQLRLAAQLCAASGVPTVTRHEVSRWEREERVPGPFWLGWLAAVLEVPLDALAEAPRPARHTGTSAPGSARHAGTPGSGPARHAGTPPPGPARHAGTPARAGVNRPVAQASG